MYFWQSRDQPLVMPSFVRVSRPNEYKIYGHQDFHEIGNVHQLNISGGVPMSSFWGGYQERATELIHSCR